MRFIKNKANIKWCSNFKWGGKEEKNTWKGGLGSDF